MSGIGGVAQATERIPCCEDVPHMSSRGVVELISYLLTAPKFYRESTSRSRRFSSLMLFYPLFEIVCVSNIKSAILYALENIDIVHCL